MSRAMDVKKEIEKEAPHSVFQGAALQNLTIPRLPSGVFVFDLLTSGGLPMGHFTEFHGAESSGKSLMALRLVGNFQKLYPNQSAVYIDFERTVDWPWASNFIKDAGRFHLLHPRYGEQGIDWAVAYTKSDDVGMLVVDSIAGMIGVKEGEGDASDQFVAMNTRLVNKMLRLLTLALADIDSTGRHVTVILINQVRTRFGAQSFQSQIEQPGGRMLKHLKTLDVRFYRKEYKKVGNTPFAIVNTFTVKKNKLGLPERSGEFITHIARVNDKPIGFVEEAKVVLDFAKKLGVISQQKSGWQYGKIQHPSLVSWVAALQEDQKLLSKIASEVLERCSKDAMASASDKDDKESEV